MIKWKKNRCGPCILRRKQNSKTSNESPLASFWHAEAWKTHTQIHGHPHDALVVIHLGSGRAWMMLLHPSTRLRTWWNAWWMGQYTLFYAPNPTFLSFFLSNHTHHDHWLPAEIPCMCFFTNKNQTQLTVARVLFFVSSFYYSKLVFVYFCSRVYLVFQISNSPLATNNCHG